MRRFPEKAFYYKKSTKQNLPGVLPLYQKQRAVVQNSHPQFPLVSEVQQSDVTLTETK